MTPFFLRHEFVTMPDNRLQEWQFVLQDEVNNGPRESVRLTRLELEVLEQVMSERGLR